MDFYRKVPRKIPCFSRVTVFTIFGINEKGI